MEVAPGNWPGAIKNKSLTHIRKLILMTFFIILFLLFKWLRNNPVTW